MKKKMTQRFTDPIHPGEILTDELEYIEMNATQLADKIDVPKNRMYQIVKGERSITADTALRLGKFFNSGPRIWMSLQKAYELDVTSREIAKELEKIKPYQAVLSNSLPHNLTH